MDAPLEGGVFRVRDSVWSGRSPERGDAHDHGRPASSSPTRVTTRPSDPLLTPWEQRPIAVPTLRL